MAAKGETNTAALGRPLHFVPFLGYKFLNSLFLGLSIGTVFVIYSPLSPSVYSLGGIALALGTLLVATQYQRILNTAWFYRISLGVELVVLAGIIGVLSFDIALETALFVYVGYQVTFTFGSYLVRCETLLISDDQRLTRLDVAKQSGYLIGMGASWSAYQFMARGLTITDKQSQVVLLQWPLLLVEILVILLLVVAFSPTRKPVEGTQ
jgi:hypothetical protein